MMIYMLRKAIITEEFAVFFTEIFDLLMFFLRM
jgi:hypothetical protein